MQQVKEAPQKHGEEPVGQEQGGSKEQEPCRRVGERREAEVVAEVWGYGEHMERKLIYVKSPYISTSTLKLTIDAHHIQQVGPDLPDGVQKRVDSVDKPVCRFGEKLNRKDIKRF